MDPFIWTGATLEDVYGARTGRIQRVVPDTAGANIVWLEVSLRRLEGTRLVPALDAVGDSRSVWVPYPRETIEDAPQGEPGPELEASLAQHFDLPAALQLA